MKKTSILYELREKLNIVTGKRVSYFIDVKEEWKVRNKFVPKKTMIDLVVHQIWENIILDEYFKRLQ